MQINMVREMLRINATEVNAQKLAKVNAEKKCC
jgi:hypothetical protein